MEIQEIEKLIENCKYFSPKIKKVKLHHPIYCVLCFKEIEPEAYYIYWEETSKEIINKLGFTEYTKKRFTVCIECFKEYKDELIQFYSEGWTVIDEKEIEEMENAE